MELNIKDYCMALKAEGSGRWTLYPEKVSYNIATQLTHGYFTWTFPDEFQCVNRNTQISGVRQKNVDLYIRYAGGSEGWKDLPRSLWAKQFKYKSPPKKGKL